MDTIEWSVKCPPQDLMGCGRIFKLRVKDPSLAGRRIPVHCPGCHGKFVARVPERNEPTAEPTLLERAAESLEEFFDMAEEIVDDLLDSFFR